MDKQKDKLKKRISKKQYDKLNCIANKKVHSFIAEYITLCNPSDVYVCDGSPDDLLYIRDTAIKNHEEKALDILGHTIHFDGYYDQARDKQQTKFLLPAGVNLGSEINAINREVGLEEIHGILHNIMQGHELFVKFFCLGPSGSPFTVPCVQLTDSAYVAHSEDLLYRQGYADFVQMRSDQPFFKFVHSQGELEPAGLNLFISKNISHRRVYIDLHDELIFSTNTQYGGNTIGLKKLAMRLAINRASQEGWLTEHMLIMGVFGPNNRKTYLAGAFPSMCGKTSTAMIQGETIVGDDIAFLRRINGEIRAVNVEKGMFGIIEGINQHDDPLQWKALHSRNEIIFSNVLVTDKNQKFWNGKTSVIPPKGVNHSGDWYPGKKDVHGNLISPSHKNARFTLELEILDNVDDKLHDPEGVPIQGLIYGGRDSDTSVPVEEAFSWEHGIITKAAALESETTAATLGKEGVRKFNPMSNLDFLSIPIGRYVSDNLRFGEDIKHPPRIFSVNYFLRDKQGNFLNHKNDKRIWLKWMELRVHDDVGALSTPTGFIPIYCDLKRLFDIWFHKEYSFEDYRQQFTVRIMENLSKIDRVIGIYKNNVHDVPGKVFDVLEDQKKRLLLARKEHGDYILPDVQ